jgi:hypothetical protein
VPRAKEPEVGANSRSPVQETKGVTTTDNLSPKWRREFTEDWQGAISCGTLQHLAKQLETQLAIDPSDTAQAGVRQIAVVNGENRKPLSGGGA